MKKTNTKVDAFIARAKRWQPEMAALRELLLDANFVEEIKWGKPCYTIDDSNVVLIVPFKDSCALLMTKGALMKDPKKILIQPTANSQSARQIRFSSLAEIVKLKTALKGYLKDAIAVEKSGVTVEKTKSKNLDFPEEFQSKLDKNPKLKTAFEALTPGRQRAYNLYFTGAKQSKTRTSRVEKCMPQILKGKGLDD